MPKSARQLAAATRKARKRAKRQLRAYRLQAQIVLWEWLSQEARRGARLDKAGLLRWRTHWLAADAGRRARQLLAASVADYRRAAKRELRHAAGGAGSLHAAVDVTLARIFLRDSEDSWEDGVLDRMLAAWARALTRSLSDSIARDADRTAT